MRSNYKRLGDYIQPVNERNADLLDLPLLGVSVQKIFFPSIANTIGTDMSTYKLIRKRQFTYIPDTSRRGDKIGIALLEDFDLALVSQAYTVFEITDTTQLLPEYLMMWFRRPEFDRYARYKSHGSAREIFDWNEMCETLLPVPSPEKQRQLVNEYHVLVDRINLNNSLIQKLEETVQAVYKEWFVDFEFPNADGKPYKSNGGEMVESEMGVIPKGWRVDIISSLISVKDGTHDSPEPVEEGNPLVTSTHLNLYDISIYEAYNISIEDFIQINKRSKVDKFDILFSMIGTIGLINYVLYDEINFAIKNVGLFKTSERKEISEFILFYLKSEIAKKYIETSLAGSTQSYVTLSVLRNMPIILPENTLLNNFESMVQAIIENIYFKVKENQKLSELKGLLLSKLATT